MNKLFDCTTFALFVFIYCFKKNDPKKSISVLLLALIFQLVDISPGLKQIYKGKYFKENNISLYLSDNQLKDPIWKILDSEKINFPVLLSIFSRAILKSDTPSPF